MFQTTRRTSLLFAALTLLDLIYHNTVRSIRKGHRDAILAILSSITQTLVMIAAFYILMSMLGMRSFAIRGDFLLSSSLPTSRQSAQWRARKLRRRP